MKIVLRIIKSAAKFAIALLVTTIFCTWSWEQFVDNKIYNCTDGGWLDYLDPGDWVHEWQGHPLKTVSQVVLDRDMEHPDTIEQGWTNDRLWALWYAFFGASLLASGAVALLPWRWYRPVR
jgi:hypothetical protein